MEQNFKQSAFKPFILPIALIAIGMLSFSNDRRFANLSRSNTPSEAQWVDSVFNALTEDERLGQLFMFRAHLDKDSAYEQSVEDLIRKYKPGGLCMFNPTQTGTVEKQAEITNRYQAASPQLPLLISMDLENGLAMRLRTSTIYYPRAMMLGALQDNRLIYEMGREVARQCRRLGVHVNFAPVADVNNNPNNPVIGERSYGEDRHNVAAKAFQYMSGLQDGGVLACAKHFPGHGDTDMDSHYDLPLIKYDRKRLDSLELHSFKMLSETGVGSFMIAHLSVPALENRPNRPTTLSRAVVTDLLRKQIGFDGLIFTDAMEMEGVKKFFPGGSADVEALKAGNDVILLPVNMEESWTAIHKALEDGSLDREQLNTSVKRVLRVKYRLGLTRPQHVEPANIRKEINTPEAYLLKRKIVAAAMTLVNDNQNLVGFPQLGKKRFASVAVGDTNRCEFQTYCGYYAPVTHFNLSKISDAKTQEHLLDSLKQFDVVLASLHGMRTVPLPYRVPRAEAGVDTMYGLDPSQIAFLDKLSKQNTVALTVFGSPYTLKWLPETSVLLQAYTEDPVAQQYAAQCLFGASDINGILPVSASKLAHFGHGIKKIFAQQRLGYDLPEAVGLSSDTLALMDSLVQEMIRTGAAPGCQILVAKDNKIVWNKAYGYYTYSQTTPVTTETIYDLASVTKVAATTISMMKLTETNQMSLDSQMSKYVPELRKTDKKSLLVKELLAHHGGLKAWIPFYLQTLNAEKLPNPKIYHSAPNKRYKVPVARDLYMDRAWVDSVWQQIFYSPLRESKDYKYSDLDLYLSARAVENISGHPVDEYADQYYYKPLGLSTTGFNPWKRGLSLRCAPTEADNYFRHQELQGYVHDMGAAMLGGVAGHAGLFSSANDLAKIFQMLLNGGSYGTIQYLQPQTVKRFTTRYEKSSRRGMGFDMKELDDKRAANMSLLAGKNTFGHLGFTGNGAWADPDKNLIFIFLSNRTYPTMENNKLGDEDFRPRLQSLVYRAMR
ncbi:MAG: glycoside hydrolase family 3 N-terminal domain-containing protein [Saprospiraceae bacterium]